MEIRQFGMGWGALLTACAFLFFLTQGIAAHGAVKGDVFVAGSIGLVVALVAAFILYPTLTVLSSALHDNDGALAPALFARQVPRRQDLEPRLLLPAAGAAAWPGTRCCSRC